MRNDQRKITWSWYFLGQSYSNQGQYELAETMFNFILPIWKKEYGENSSAVTIIISELALVYREQGDLAKAEQYSKKAIKLITQLDGKRVIWGVSLEKIISLVEQILGTNHPELASSLNSLALSYYKKGSYQEAEALYLRAIEIVEKTFGEEHTELVSYRNNLAELYLARVS
ncbi:tetratricopeptide repeat protein [Legionella maceachernii]